MIEIAAAMMLLQGASAPPQLRTPPQSDPYARCVCVDVDQSTLVSFTGVVVDAQLLLGEDGRSPADRQATIFRVVKTLKGEVASPARIWHVTAPENCGVTFDYGKRYTVVAINNDGAFETNWCVAPKPSE